MAVCKMFNTNQFYSFQTSDSQHKRCSPFAGILLGGTKGAIYPSLTFLLYITYCNKLYNYDYHHIQ